MPSSSASSSSILLSLITTNTVLFSFTSKPFMFKEVWQLEGNRLVESAWPQHIILVLNSQHPYLFQKSPYHTEEWHFWSLIIHSAQFSEHLLWTVYSDIVPVRVHSPWSTTISFLVLLWRRKWQPTPVSLPGKCHGQRSLVDCSPWGCKESGTTEQLTLTMIFYELFENK